MDNSTMVLIGVAVLWLVGTAVSWRESGPVSAVCFGLFHFFGWVVFASLSSLAGGSGLKAG